MYAVMQDRGKQYKVRTGEEILVDLMDSPAGSSVGFDRILLLRSPSAGVIVGSPTIEGAKVEARVLGENLGPRTIHFRLVRGNHSRKKKGHRQQYTRLMITGITPPKN